MDESAILIVTATLFAWGLVSRRLERADLSAPIVFTLVRLQEIRQDAGRYVRLLGIGLPLSMLAGWGLGVVLFPGLGVWLALLVGAALAPTDAALGVPVVTTRWFPLGFAGSSRSRAG